MQAYSLTAESRKHKKLSRGRR